MDPFSEEHNIIVRFIWEIYCEFWGDELNWCEALPAFSLFEPFRGLCIYLLSIPLLHYGALLYIPYTFSKDKFNIKRSQSGCKETNLIKGVLNETTNRAWV